MNLARFRDLETPRLSGDFSVNAFLMQQRPLAVPAYGRIATGGNGLAAQVALCQRPCYSKAHQAAHQT
jgi:hypothetical protein